MKMHLQRDGEPHRVVTSPNLEDAGENAYRRRLIGACRGFGRNAELFRKFPASVRWRWGELNRMELRQVRYINDDYWVELSGGSRSPVDAARRVAPGNRGLWRQQRDIPFHPAEIGAGYGSHRGLILVGAEEDGYQVVLEGHVRLTACMLAPEAPAVTARVVIGIAPEFVNWPPY
ncbi:MAG: hypothetical protein M3457_23145 [Chloroflexota bacterium]|nr:hypothetical protein [Chloroflexota bacterium]